MENEVLTPNQLELLGHISKEKNITCSFFLTGGTALSYFYFKHRFSEDLDFFSTNELNTRVILAWVKNANRDTGSVKVEQQSLSSQEVFYFYFPDNSFVKIDFAYYPFDHIGEFKKFGDLKISSVADIAVNKLMAILTRQRSRDYLDLYHCLKSLGWASDELKRNYQLKFGVTLGDEQVLTSYANIMDSSDLPRFLGNFDWEEVEKFFLEQSNEMKGKIIK